MRHPLTFPILCVIAREQLLEDPTITNGEWSERIKDRLVRLRLAYPDPPHRLHDAMTAVERALAKEGRPRPGVRTGRIQASRPTPPSALSHDEALDALRRLQARGLLRTMPTPRPVSRRVLAAHRAAALVAQELVATIARGEALEQTPMTSHPQPPTTEASMTDPKQPDGKPDATKTTTTTETGTRPDPNPGDRGGAKPTGDRGDRGGDR